jgi:hypothetical protein
MRVKGIVWQYLSGWAERASSRERRAARREGRTEVVAVVEIP